MPQNLLGTWSEYIHPDDPILVLMLLCSVLIVAIALERWLNLQRAKSAIRRLDEKVVEAARRGDLEEARRLCEGVSTPVREIFTSGLDRALGRVRGLPRVAMNREQKRAIASFRNIVWTLGTAGALMPFVGLLGTVLGVMSSFHAISASGTGGFAVVSAGISAALIATAAGLFVALEAVIFFNYLQNAIAAVARELGLLVDETAELIETHARPAAER
jgi:biopolymer transport protein ExbB